VTHPDTETASPVRELIASLTVAIGGMRDDMRKDYARKRELSRNIVPLTVEMTGVTASATVDLPNILGPLTGWYWDIQTMICQGLTAGTISVYHNSSAGIQWAQFSSNGQLNWGKKQFILASGERLVFVGSSGVPATGAFISFRGTQIAAPWYGDYAL